jgi:hypothetical protein
MKVKKTATCTSLHGGDPIKPLPNNDSSALNDARIKQHPCSRTVTALQNNASPRKRVDVIWVTQAVVHRH